MNEKNNGKQKSLFHRALCGNGKRGTTMTLTRSRGDSRRKRRVLESRDAIVVREITTRGNGRLSNGFTTFQNTNNNRKKYISVPFRVCAFIRSCVTARIRICYYLRNALLTNITTHGTIKSEPNSKIVRLLNGFQQITTATRNQTRVKYFMCFRFIFFFLVSFPAPSSTTQQRNNNNTLHGRYTRGITIIIIIIIICSTPMLVNDGDGGHIPSASRNPVGLIPLPLST